MKKFVILTLVLLLTAGISSVAMANGAGLVSQAVLMTFQPSLGTEEQKSVVYAMCLMITARLHSII
ncbi:MAG: hypothetical protein L0958_05370 [Candidatus Mariimomonas ferrooxydans]